MQKKDELSKFRITMIPFDLKGDVHSATDCPIVRAVSRRWPAHFVSCGYEYVRMYPRYAEIHMWQHERRFYLSAAAMAWQKRLMDGQQAKPIIFYMTETKEKNL